MALKPQVTTPPDKITYVQASGLLAKLGTLGVPCSNLCEELAMNGELNYVPVTDSELWQDDGTPGIYYASVWGKFVDIRRTWDFLNNKTLSPLNRLIQVASVSFETDSPALTNSLALQAIDGLDRISAVINSVVSSVAPV